MMKRKNKLKEAERIKIIGREIARAKINSLSEKKIISKKLGINSGKLLLTQLSSLIYQNLPYK